jgi:hypothetical protein
VTFRFHTSCGFKISPVNNPIVQDHGDFAHRLAPPFCSLKQAGNSTPLDKEQLICLHLRLEPFTKALFFP